MNKWLMLAGLVLCGSVVAQTITEIQLGRADLSFSLPGKRSAQAPDTAVNDFDVCQWLAAEKNQAHQAGKTVLRKLWDFKRFLRGRTGSLSFQVYVSRNVDHKGDFVEYMDVLAEDIQKRIDGYSDEFREETGYGPVTDLTLIERGDHTWAKFYTDNRSTFHLFSQVGDELMIKLNFTQWDERKDQNGVDWHPQAQSLTDHIVSSLQLNWDPAEPLCD